MLRKFGRLLGLVAALSLLGADGCPAEDGNTPTANAGSDLVVELGEQASLDGEESSDPGGLALTYHWSLEFKPVTSSVTDDAFSRNGNAEAATTSFVPDTPGQYGVTLYVENENGQRSDLDYVRVVAGSTNTPPVADAGEDLVVAVDMVADLDGSASMDPEGAELEYEWAFDLVPPDSALTQEDDLFNQGSPDAAIVPDVAGQYVLRLRVYDGEFWSTPDFVTVSAVDDNEPPLANAGESYELTPCSPDTITLDGRGSYDPEGADVTYAWEVVSVPNGSAVSTANLVDADTGTPSFDWDEVGLYTLRLVVNDGELDSLPDYVAIRTVPHEPNSGPTADSGGDITIYATAFCTNNTCSPCGERSELLDGSGSLDPDHDELDFTWTITSGAATINGEHAEQAEIVLPSQDTTPNNQTVTVTLVQLDVEDCQGPTFGDTDDVTVTFYCFGQVY